MNTAMPHRTKAIMVNALIIAELAVEYWRGAPRLALAITGGIALPLANTLMLLKRRRALRASSL